MNKRYLLENEKGEQFFCVLSSDRGEEEQWCEVFAIEKGHGFTAERWGDTVRIRDYFAAEDRAVFKILSQEETDDPADCSLNKR